ncbi:microfibril-associated glycoprotein 4-like isoform X2 [Watersipora subatra]|uniref:microfibril-associated glycoprotein 4-like isoform X2 n=1 Tax=Watersipora subatra TaxID=2589382 RepID=UPI00355AD6E6
MATLSFLALLILFISVTSQSNIGPYSAEQELFVHRQQIYTVYQFLQNECPELVRLRRDVYNENMLPLHLEVAKIVYGNLLQALQECRANDSATQPTAEQLTGLSVLDRPPIPQDCQQLYDHGSRSPGVYLIDPLHADVEPFSVWCDFFDNHGWTVFQKRVNGSIDFYRNWTEYKSGFGNIAGEHWLGLTKLYALTRSNQKLNILLMASNKVLHSGTWASFFIQDENDNYRLEVSDDGYEGSLAASGLSVHNGMAFSTKDRDNDLYSGACAVTYHGAWWYNSCHHSNLNGGYNMNNSSGISWSHFSNSPVETVMRISRD